MGSRGRKRASTSIKVRSAADHVGAWQFQYTAPIACGSAAVKERFFLVLTEAGEMARKMKTHILFVMDGVNQLSPFNGALSLDWLPSYVPPGIKMVLSMVADTESHAALMRRDPRPPMIEIPSLAEAERTEIVVRQLSEYRKKLTSQQMRLLLDKKESSKPLFLLTACEELRLQAQYGLGGSGVDVFIRSLPGEIPSLLDMVLDRVERDLAAWAKTAAAGAILPEGLTITDPGKTPLIRRPSVRDMAGGGAAVIDAAADEHLFNEELTDPDLIARQIVKKTLTLIDASRHGLQESELLELLAPRGKKLLPPIVWARLYRSLELYLHPLGDEENGMLGFFSQQMVNAVRNRYLQNNRLREAEVCSRLATFFRAKADPSDDFSFSGESQRYIEDLVYYHLRALKIDDVKEILGSLIFIERRSKRGAGQMELLLRDYYLAVEEIRSIKLSVLKVLLSKDDFNRFSRAALLSWLGEYLVFVGSHHTSRSRGRIQ